MRITQWDQRLSTDESNKVFFLLSEAHLCHVSDGVIKDAFAVMLASQDVSALSLYELDYTKFRDLDPEIQVRDVRHLRQILAFFSKRRDLDIGVDTREVAWRIAREAEQLCRETNQIFRSYNQGGFCFPLDVESVLFRAQRKISRILGDLPTLAELKLKFGPGATTQVKKKDASARRKLAQMFCCSEEAGGVLDDVLAEVPLWAGVSPSTGGAVNTVAIDRGRVDFVPKSAKTDRTISVEPMLNSFVQLGIGTYMASQLAKEGVNIRDQTLNQRLAREGSLSGGLATLDLSSASDTIASGLVESLFPLDWWSFLRTFRTGVSSSPDGVVKLEKFSSMGNGFTFPLETLLFYSLAYACCRAEDHKLVNAYGDDIIVPTYAVPLLTKTLCSLGFIVNRKKSFSEGPFRESCGKDYYSGIDIRPCYMKDALSGVSCFVLHNFYVRTGQPELCHVLVGLLDESLHLYGPDGFGDGHLLGDYNLEPHNRHLGWGGFTFETFTRKTRSAFYKLGADHVFPSYSIYMKDEPIDPTDVEGVFSHQSRANGIIPEGTRASRYLRRNYSGGFRPERSDSIYKKHEGKWLLADTLPGYQGYKRIKIYLAHFPA